MADFKDTTYFDTHIHFTSKQTDKPGVAITILSQFQFFKLQK